MPKLFPRLLLALAVGAAACAASAQTLRIGLAEDPDVLDPSLARTFVGRVVFSSLCDKLFDIDEKLNIVPQLATSYQWAPDNKTLLVKMVPEDIGAAPAAADPLSDASNRVTGTLGPDRHLRGGEENWSSFNALRTASFSAGPPRLLARMRPSGPIRNVAGIDRTR